MLRTLSFPASRLQNDWAIRRGFSLSSTLMSRGPRRIVVSSLKPNELTSDDYRDLSGRRHTDITYNQAAKVLCRNLYWEIFKKDFLPFPPKTHGFFYYHTPKNAPIFAGGIRFRVCPSKDPKSFQDGFDLLKFNGLPWEVTNWELRVGTQNFKFGEELIRTRVIHSDAIDKCMELASDAKLTATPSQPLVYAFQQPFVMTFGRASTRIWIGDEERMRPLLLYNDPIRPFLRGETLDKRVKHQEAAHVCFDLKGDNVVLRVVSVPPRYARKIKYDVGETLRIRPKASDAGFKASEALAILRNSTFRNSWS